MDVGYRMWITITYNKLQRCQFSKWLNVEKSPHGWNDLYNVALRCFHVTILSGMPSACPVLYCHLWTVCFYHILPQYLMYGTISRKTSWTWNVFCFRLQFMSQTFLIISRIQRDSYINIQILVQSTHSSCQIFIKLGYSRQTLEI